MSGWVRLQCIIVMHKLPDLLPGARGEDYGLYFKGSWLKCAWHGAEPAYRYMRGIDLIIPDPGTHKTGVILTFSMPDMHSCAMDAADVLADLMPPVFGFFPYRQTVILLRRATTQSATKGLSTSNVNLYDPLWPSLRDLYHDYGFPKWGIPDPDYNRNESLLGEVLNDPRSGVVWDKAIRMLEHQEKPTLAVMITKAIALSLGIWSKHPTIWFWEKPIGEAISEHKAVVYDSLFYTEMVDALSPMGVHVEFNNRKEQEFVCLCQERDRSNRKSIF